jgi:beta-phosphoglucomutase-like phosphatase (HAD superfamily)
MDSKHTILWDMDGVLGDSSELHYQPSLETLESLSITFDRDQFRWTFGMNNTAILTILLGKMPDADFVDMVSDHKESRFRQLMRRRAGYRPTSWQRLRGF